MSIPARLSHYLRQHGIGYEICAHKLSSSSIETARAAHIQAQQLAKSVILEDEAGLVMAIVPADQSVMVGQLTRLLGRPNLHLADEIKVAMQFEDCQAGAVPSVGMAWGMDTVVDDALDSSATVYLESGDHERLLRLTHEQFLNLMGDRYLDHFSKPLKH
ncbi:MAG TPA: YbaK/EbsC family protein [Spongiibacteraceae bacterium]|nr:YbaK/EbsC family protein [Spongiibacteraceae bacterium]